MFAKLAKTVPKNRKAVCGMNFFIYQADTPMQKRTARRGGQKSSII